MRVRYAPSPTGFMHLGGLRTALFNYLLAKKDPNGTFILRIENTDTKRIVPGSVKSIVNALNWAGIPPDEGPDIGGNFGPYIQSERINIYQQHASKLLEAGAAYRCFCDEERLQRLRDQCIRRGITTMYDRHCTQLTQMQIENLIKSGKPYTIRLRIPPGRTTVNDLIRGKVEWNNHMIDDSVLLKSDGFPTYHLASVVDDHLMEITTVLRGEEWLPSIPKHIHIYNGFQWKQPEFAHVSLLLNPDKTKLSKRQNAASVQWYQDHGFLPEAVVNFIALLGWTPPPALNKEILTMPEMIEHFCVSDINKSGAVVDHQRLLWLNKEHLKLVADKNIDRLLPSLKETLQDSFDCELSQFNHDKLTLMLKLGLDRVNRVQELPSVVKFCFRSPDVCISELHNLSISHETLEQYANMLSRLEEFSQSSSIKLAKALAKKAGIPGKNLLLAVRYALTGELQGFPLGAVMELLGKDTCIERLNNFKLNIVQPKV